VRKERERCGEGEGAKEKIPNCMEKKIGSAVRWGVWCFSCWQLWVRGEERGMGGTRSVKVMEKRGGESHWAHGCCLRRRWY
jgi:hypothetical protein